MDIDPEDNRPASQAHVPEQVAERKEALERKYNEYLDTVAPYLRSAFKEWLAQAQTTPLSAFLVHYFGRQPDDRELQSIEQLMLLRGPLIEAPDGDRSAATRPGRSEKEDAINLADTRMANESSEPSAPLLAKQVTPASSDSNGLRPDDGNKEVEASSSKLQPGEAYERLACVGEGTYGKVYKARRVEDGSFRALKRIRMEGEKDGFPVTAMREIKLLQGLKHDNIIRLYEMMVSRGKQRRCDQN
jgi:CTD kinase subunit alpha